MRILRFDELDSTNAYAKRNCSLLADKTIILAHTQTAGRGRLKRTWLSEEGGLYFSLVLKPQTVSFLPNLTQLMAVAVCRAVQAWGVHVHIKWPNDVLADGKKLGGILSEAVTSAARFEGLVLGTGVNVSQADLSQAGQPAVSLAELGVHVGPEEVLQRITAHFFDAYEAVLQQGFAAIAPMYKELFPYIGRLVTVKQETAIVQGTVQTISPRGELVLHTSQGETIISIGDLCI